ncbi:scopoletin glucosyltransferase-like [Prosopis cineraria]|uniref:scopoletin glucosyltransferase-like n=1 Tax=Prosopis cineraria TaxID=364024 RepID=UPI00240EAA67|nr:scopoletin glucosyltransferase-like [Prosopis cineraria]
MSAEIFVVPFFGQGHLFPCMELCKHLASRNFMASLVIPSDLTSSIPASFRDYPLVQIHEVSSSLLPPSEPGSQSHPLHAHRTLHAQLALGIEKLLSVGPHNPNPPRPVCAILDIMVNWLSDSFKKLQVPTVAFFTSGACSAALEYAIWKAHPEDLKPDEIRLLPGLPDDVALASSDLKRRPHGPPPLDGGGPPPDVRAGPRMKGPPKPGEQPPWLEDARKTNAMMINTCDDLERPFIEYIAKQTGKPVWGVGPLLPEHYWKSAGSLIHDRLVRTNRRSNVSEDEVIQWLDSKPRGSVLYVSFGSEVGPTMEEYPQLAEALESSDRPFIWVIQPNSGKPGPPRPRSWSSKQPGSQVKKEEEEKEGYFPHGVDSRVGKRGLIICGWAPQLLILSHPSTGGFLTHCGWNSTVEAIGRGVPFLVWPIRGDQYHDAKLVVGHLKVGHMISDDLSQMVKKDGIVEGIERLMTDKEIKSRAESLSAMFQNGFPRSSEAALDTFFHYINQRPS